MAVALASHRVRYILITYPRICIQVIMQTFLPLPDLQSSAAILDRQRLGQQRRECAQILRVLYGLRTGWYNHPAVRMWRGYEPALNAYAIACCDEWEHRGYEDNMRELFLVYADPPLPPWFGGPIHASHRAALLLKLPAYYEQFGWSELPEKAYHWPVPK